jgi:hypothetical protein
MDKFVTSANRKLFFLLISILALNLYSLKAQDTVVVEGVVLSHLKQPVPDVPVSIEGSSLLPVVTDQAGRFRLRSTSGEDWIIVSPTGEYKSKRIFLNNRKNLTIYLTANDISSGYDQLSVLDQQILKRNVISSHSELNTQDIHQSAVLSVNQYMQGRVPGMNVVNRSGTPGSGAYATLRGVNSLHATNLPLYIVDGIPLTSLGIFGSNLAGFEYNPLLGINLSDISRTTIVKDPQQPMVQKLQTDSLLSKHSIQVLQKQRLH